ncbi:MAG: AAA family ATPase [Planctomycetaceae bacterium]|nr:AAA family ATPase [Planctomycetaceae bacterium]
MNDSHPSTEGTQRATSDAERASAGVLAPIRDTGLAPVQPQYFPPAYGSAGDPLAGGIDYKRAWHAFRRRWLPAAALGLVAATALAVPIWLFMPKGFEAVAWLRVRDKTGMFGGGGRDNAEYESYRKTQVQLIKSPFVLTSALRRPGVSDLKTLQDEKQDQVGWLARNIQVSAPMESEVLQVRLRGESASDVTMIVNAVTQAYLSDVVNKEKADRLERRDTIERQYKQNMTEVRRRRDEYNNLAKTLGASDSIEVATQRSLLLDHLGTLRAQMTSMQRDLSVLDAELAVLDAKARGDIRDEDAVPNDMLDAMLARDPMIAELRDRLAILDEAMTFQAERSARGANDPAVKRLESQRASLMERIRERGAELRPQVIAQMSLDAAGRRSGAADGPGVLRMRRQLTTQELDVKTKEFDKVAKEVTELGQANADLSARRSEIEQLEKVTEQMGMQLQASEVDIAMPARVELIEEASVPEGSDELFRIMLTILAGLGGLGLGSGAVVVFEYLRDRVSTAEEISQRVGVRVVGTLPQVSRSRKRSTAGEMAESVDGVRAVISQTGREAPKVILVTSAVGHEGKTTFAAQLAASLARSDKRTLLLDGDLRHPNVHLALELDLRAGLPELLRGEIGNDEAVQPTAIEGLFAVTGGTCDYAAITALSRPELAKVIKGFRESFDHVVIDAGPVLAFADALLLGQLSDVALVATMRDVSRVPADSSSRRFYASSLPS